MREATSCTIMRKQTKKKKFIKKTKEGKMELLNINYVPNKEVEALGMVRGNVVQSKNIGRDIMAGVKGVVGGELKGYTEMLSEARDMATSRMIAQAESLGADAIINVRYTSGEIVQGAAEILAYGTAVKIK